jgi:hypothetical protein
MAIDARSGFETYRVLFLGAVALGWMVMCICWERFSKSGLEEYRDIMSEYSHLTSYVRDMNGILYESLEALSAHDREKAVEIAHKFNSLSTKALYESYWRDPARGESVEHE